ncbi:hypothetical protein CSUI_006471 [Cystoisospora suis]|uniref:Uncharacterized protein n=1 Tax=Cystoisospora suis TaxID=483139 RepID=A0A2C6KTE1_9APIC|nr:hypothetical protein CSUI_006471 [Cystoisospora suis]
MWSVAPEAAHQRQSPAAAPILLFPLSLSFSFFQLFSKSRKRKKYNSRTQPGEKRFPGPANRRVSPAAGRVARRSVATLSPPPYATSQ